jgi:dihydrolipoamide dehydrogenase
MSQYDVAVIGGGPGGYVAAIRCAQLGMRVSVIERDALGGLCLNWGCIPSKALLRNAEVVHLFRRAADWGVTTGEIAVDFGAAVKRSRSIVNRMVKGVEYLMRKHEIDVIKGSAYLRGPGRIEVRPQGETVEARQVIIATGARNRTFPNMPVDGETVITSTEGMVLPEVPQKVILVGGGPVGVEFAYVFWAYGADVTIVEMLDHLLPFEDAESSAQLERQYGKYGINILTQTRVETVEVDNGSATVRVTSPSGSQTLQADKVLIGVGFQGNTEDLGLEALGVETERGFIRVTPQRRTNVPGVWAVGDVTGPPLLAHVAMAEGVIAAEDIGGQSPPALDYVQMPRATYCQPQVASIGLTEEAAGADGRAVKVGRFPLRANGKALALGDHEGFAKVVIDAQTEEFLGVHLVGPDVTELLGELSLARTLEATAVEMGLAVHPHPSLSEVIKEAALAARGEAIHV